MQNQLQSDENQTPQTAYLLVAQTPSAIESETESETQARQVADERIEEITRCANQGKRLIHGYFIAMGVFGMAMLLEILLMLLPETLLPAILLPLKTALMRLPFFFWFPIQMMPPALLHLAVNRANAPKFDAQEAAKRGGAAVSPLLSLLESGQKKERWQSAAAALTALLPQMKASDAPLLTPAARQTLHRFVGGNPASLRIAPSCGDTLRIAMLKALEQVGDSSAIPVVERLANAKARTADQIRIRQAAIDCLPLLRANCGEIETARILLRASRPETTEPATLLRPATGGTATDAAELLRGAEPRK